MNAKLFGALLMTMAENAGDRLLDPSAANDLLTWFGKAEALWLLLEQPGEQVELEDGDDGH